MTLRLVAALAAPLTITAAQAEPPAGVAPPAACGEHAAMTETLRGRYGETRVAAGVENSGHVIEVFASARNGSWTILATDPGGTACVMSVGEHFEPRPARRSEETAWDARPTPAG